MGQDWNVMLQDIISDSNPGSLESTPRHTKNATLFKRDGGAVDVEWISINYDDSNSDLSREVAEDRQIEEEEYDSTVYDWFDNNHGWKYCIAAEKNDHTGVADVYDDIGKENAFHGELYFNTYGGVYSY
ncbi:hypothetical protein TPHA_0A00100 [Tetrapisispora phaffii CBS 4417]|uniref:Uncharacterized protein n=1 Tax=Tetrapisispora phaffii (strain ATCC 24235 / CBS 4417 / NBRC 1672 / NRRL Y-8282 / UCD 70-5) TaxID=1071381 RepID=G8BMG7_TETPH|nr:hypothetical protein TPHA_0A00100 [Tetrapisispora phaffii CBS 4417]CCE61095.1 hypothetical protein TPHA_0A00100 [Tetrapisispora phaffii CBS 4417]